MVGCGSGSPPSTRPGGVGAGSGQCADKEPNSLGLLTGGFVDPFHHSTVQKPSHVVHSRLDDRALAVEAAAADLRPARMGGTTVDSRIYKGNIAGPGRADDGTPAGYPDDHAEFVMSIVRWAHVGHAQTERVARYLADSIVAGWTSARLLRCGGSRRRTCR